MKPKTMGLHHYFMRFIEGEGEGGGTAGSEDDASGDGTPGDGQLNEHGYPDNTPIKEMTAEQQAAYWKYHSRKNENLLKSSVPKDQFDKVQSELDKTRREKLPEADKALEDARADARAEAAKEFAPRLARHAMRAAVAGRLSDEKLDEHLEFVDLTKFIKDDGDVDTDKVARYAAGIAPEKEPAPTPNRKGWTSGPGGADRDKPRSGAHSVASAKEEHLESLRSKK